MDESLLLAKILIPVLTAILVAGVLWIFKVPKSLQKNSDAIEKLTHVMTKLEGSLDAILSRLENHSKQHNVTQRLISDIIGEPVDIAKIADDYSHYPRTLSRSKKEH